MVTRRLFLKTAVKFWGAALILPLPGVVKTSVRLWHQTAEFRMKELDQMLRDIYLPVMLEQLQTDCIFFGRSNIPERSNR